MSARTDHSAKRQRTQSTESTDNGTLVQSVPRIRTGNEGATWQAEKGEILRTQPPPSAAVSQGKQVPEAGKSSVEGEAPPRARGTTTSARSTGVGPTSGERRSMRVGTLNVQWKDWTVGQGPTMSDNCAITVRLLATDSTRKKTFLNGKYNYVLGTEVEGDTGSCECKHS